MNANLWLWLMVTRTSAPYCRRGLQAHLAGADVVLRGIGVCRVRRRRGVAAVVGVGTAHVVRCCERDRIGRVLEIPLVIGVAADVDGDRRHSEQHRHKQCCGDRDN